MKKPSKPKPAPTPATQHDAFALKNDVVERALAGNDQTGLLEDFFGPAQYQELRRLAQQSASRAVRGGPRVLILPGIMGSTLGYPGAVSSIFDDAIWLDLVDIANGRLTRLDLVKGDRKIEPLGVILFTYLALKLRLRIAGFDVDFHPYDWRRSLVDLGAELSAKLDREKGPVQLVAHSMGGLVARASLLRRSSKLRRVVTLGTPHFGAFAPVLAFRGVHPVVRKLQFVDLKHSSQELCAVFGGFPGLCEMLPAADKVEGVDYFGADAWPETGFRPTPAQLAAARRTRESLPAKLDDLVQIVGVNRETVVSAKIENGEFVYGTSMAGDGTVPLSCAVLPGAKQTYYIEEEHGSLPNNRTVAKALETILTKGTTSLLDQSWEASRSAMARSFTESAWMPPMQEFQRGRALSTRERRELLRPFVAPDDAAVAGEIETSMALAQVEPAELNFSSRVVIGRQRQQRLDITLVRGNLTEVEADSYVLGLFRHVSPGGAARAVDRLLDGALEQMLSRRMFNAGVGEISVMPTGRHPVRADFVSFVGLGDFDSFKEEVLEVVGENLVRTFVATRVDNFATVAFGGGSGALTRGSLQRLLTGFLRGLVDADTEQRFRGITICETDAERFDDLRRDLFSLSGTALFEGVEVTLREQHLPPPVQVRAAVEAPRTPDPVYLIVRRESDEKDRSGLSASILTAGAKAAIYKGWRTLDDAAIDRHLRGLDALATPALPRFGRTLASLVLPDNVRSVLAQYRDHHLVVVHDAQASRYPWETIYLDNWSPALGAGLSHRYEAANLSVAKWLQQRQQAPVLSVLLIVNPTEDLEGAEVEGARVLALLKTRGSAVKLTVVKNREARKETLLELFNSGKFDMIHYAGHAYFDVGNRSESGILCAGGKVLSGADLAGLSNLPSLVFFNACESARIRKLGRTSRSKTVIEGLGRNVGFAEAFLRGGVANYVGTYWPVGDAAAKLFAETFYQNILDGQTLGATIQAGRQALLKARERDWADYILYGDPGFALKKR